MLTVISTTNTEQRGGFIEKRSRLWTSPWIVGVWAGNTPRLESNHHCVRQNQSINFFCRIKELASIAKNQGAKFILWHPDDDIICPHHTLELLQTLKEDKTIASAIGRRILIHKKGRNAPLQLSRFDISPLLTGEFEQESSFERITSFIKEGDYAGLSAVYRVEDFIKMVASAADIYEKSEISSVAESWASVESLLLGKRHVSDKPYQAVYGLDANSEGQRLVLSPHHGPRALFTENSRIALMEIKRRFMLTLPEINETNAEMLSAYLLNKSLFIGGGGGNHHPIERIPLEKISLETNYIPILFTLSTKILTALNKDQTQEQHSPQHRRRLQDSIATKYCASTFFRKRPHEHAPPPRKSSRIL